MKYFKTYEAYRYGVNGVGSLKNSLAALKRQNITGRYVDPETLAQGIRNEYEAITGEKYEDEVQMSMDNTIADIIGHYKLDGPDFMAAWDKVVKESVNENEIKVGDIVYRKFPGEDSSQTFKVISISGRKAKLKDNKTGKQNGMYLSDLVKESLNEAKDSVHIKKLTDTFDKFKLNRKYEIMMDSLFGGGSKIAVLRKRNTYGGGAMIDTHKKDGGSNYDGYIEILSSRSGRPIPGKSKFDNIDDAMKAATKFVDSIKESLNELSSAQDGTKDSDGKHRHEHHLEEDIEAMWKKAYGENFSSQYPAVAKIIKQRKIKDKREIARIWQDTYGEDFEKEYPALFQKLS